MAPTPAMAVIRLENCSRYGKVNFDDEQMVSTFLEKDGMSSSGWINAGLYHLKAELFQNWDGSKFSLERKLFPELVKKKILRCVPIDAEFIDIGIPQDYQKFCDWSEEGRKGKLCS